MESIRLGRNRRQLMPQHTQRPILLLQLQQLKVLLLVNLENRLTPDTIFRRGFNSVFVFALVVWIIGEAEPVAE